MGSGSLAVVISADDGYAMQLAVAVRSILEHLPASTHLELFVIDGGISPSNKQRCERSWARGTSSADSLGELSAACSVQWIKPDLDRLSRFQASDHFTLATYFRFFIGDLLPQRLERVLYTDPDVLFLSDITPLLTMDLQGFPLAASQDAYCPFVDSRHVLENFADRSRGFYGLCAIPDALQRGIPAAQPYLNAGMLVFDLVQFRNNHFGDQLLAYCREHRDQLLWADQCAINAILGGRWLPLDAGWNVTPPVFWTDDHGDTIYDQATFDRIRSRPAMVHFAGPDKPWHAGCVHPFTQRYCEWIDRTAWRGWQPEARGESNSTGRKPRMLRLLRSLGRRMGLGVGSPRRAA